MFQAIKRALFLSRNNFAHEEGDLIRLHLRLQKSAWPANEFVDMFMRCHTNWDPTFDELSFKMFMCDQYDWVCRDDVEALKRIYERIDTPEFRGVDNVGLIRFVYQMVEGAKLRQPTSTSDPDIPVRPVDRTSSIRTPTAELSAQTPLAERIPSSRTIRPVARDTSGRGDIRLADRFGLSPTPGGIEPESLRYETGISILDDAGWIPYNSGSVAARCLEKHGIRTLRGALKYSQNELHEFEASSEGEFVADLVDSISRLAGKFDESEQSDSPAIANENSTPVSPPSNPIKDWREELRRGLIRSGCQFDGIYVVLPNGARKVAVSGFDLQDIHDELKDKDRGPEKNI